MGAEDLLGAPWLSQSGALWPSGGETTRCSRGARLSTCSRTLAVASWNPGYAPHPWPWSAPQGGATSRCPTSKDDRPVRPCVSREGWRAGGWGSSPVVEFPRLEGAI